MPGDSDEITVTAYAYGSGTRGKAALNGLPHSSLQGRPFRIRTIFIDTRYPARYQRLDLPGGTDLDKTRPSVPTRDDSSIGGLQGRRAAELVELVDIDQRLRLAKGATQLLQGDVAGVGDGT